MSSLQYTQLDLWASPLFTRTSSSPRALPTRIRGVAFTSLEHGTLGRRWLPYLLPCEESGQLPGDRLAPYFSARATQSPPHTQAVQEPGVQRQRPLLIGDALLVLGRRRAGILSYSFDPTFSEIAPSVFARAPLSETRTCTWRAPPGNTPYLQSFRPLTTWFVIHLVPPLSLLL